MHPSDACEEACLSTDVVDRLCLIHRDGVVREGIGVPLPAVIPRRRLAEVGQEVESSSVYFEGQVVTLAVPYQGGIVEHYGPAMRTIARFQNRQPISVQNSRLSPDL